MLLTDQRFCIAPPYSTRGPAALISPTNVAAVNCHALSPALSQLGYAKPGHVPPFPTFVDLMLKERLELHGRTSPPLRSGYEIRPSPHLGRAILADSWLPGLSTFV